MDQRAGIGVDNKQIGLEIPAIVVAVANNHDVGGGTADLDLADRRVGVGKAEVGEGRIGGVVDGGRGDLPQDVIRGSGFAGRCQSGAAGDVERIDTLAASPQRADQDPFAARQDGRRIGRAVNKIVEDVRGDRQRLHLRNQHRRYIGPALLARDGVDGVQHAVVGTDEHGRLGGVFDEQRSRMDDGTQCRSAGAVGAALANARTAQVVDHPGGPQRGLLCGTQVAI